MAAPFRSPPLARPSHMRSAMASSRQRRGTPRVTATLLADTACTRSIAHARDASLSPTPEAVDRVRDCRDLKLASARAQRLRDELRDLAAHVPPLVVVQLGRGRVRMAGERA